VSQPPSARRFAVWAAFLALPLVLGAVAYPWVSRRLGAGGGERAVARAAAAARTAEGAAAASARRADAALGEGGAPGPTGRPAGGISLPASAPEAPTAAQIEAAREAELAAARAQQGWQKVETMAPRQARPGADGELVAPFQGFGLSVESTPPGATVTVDGRDAGETPLVTTVDCRPGDPVEVRVELRPLPPQARTVQCRADALLTLPVALSKAAPAKRPRPGP
jgi:hypothetical protein